VVLVGEFDFPPQPAMYEEPTIRLRATKAWNHILLRASRFRAATNGNSKNGIRIHPEVVVVTVSVNATVT
jgi:hypothetical protein